MSPIRSALRSPLSLAPRRRLARALSFTGLAYASIFCLEAPQLHEASAQAQAPNAWEVIVNSADIYAGPSQAYSVRGRTFLGERLRVVGSSPKQDWLQVVTPAGVKGWVRAESLRNSRRQVAQDPGRFRRQTEYQYDAQGRRITSAGAAAGSGEGFGQASQAAPQQLGSSQPSPTQGAQGIGGMGAQGMGAQAQMTQPPSGFPGASRGSSAIEGLKIQLIPAGLNMSSRRFTSDIKLLSPLAKTESEALLYQYGLNLSYGVNQHFMLRLEGSDARGAEVTTPAHPQRPELLPPSQLGTSMTKLGLSALGGLPLGKLWVGGGAGLQYFMHSFKELAFGLPELKGFTPLQSHSYLSATAGLTARLALKGFDFSLEGGVLLPLSMSASPYQLGAWQGLGYYGDLRFGFELTELIGFGLYMGGQYLGVDVSSTGAYSDRIYSYSAELVNLGTPAAYKRASTSDMAINGGLYLQLSL